MALSAGTRRSDDHAAGYWQSRSAGEDSRVKRTSDGRMLVDIPHGSDATLPYRLCSNWHQ